MSNVTVEKYDPDNGGSWTVVADFKLKTKKSHFCTVFYQDPFLSNSFVYVIGGWNRTYLNEVHRVQVDTDIKTDNWEELEGMTAAR